MVFIGGLPMKRATKRLAGPLVDRLRFAHLLQAAVADDGDAVGHGHRLDLVVGDVDEGGAEPAVQLDQLEAGLGAELGVEVGQRLVHEEHLGPAHDGPGQGDALALPAGELAGLAVEVVGRARGRRRPPATRSLRSCGGEPARRLLATSGDSMFFSTVMWG